MWKICLLLFLCISVHNSSGAIYNYAEALQKAIYFYDEQRAGKLPSNNRVSWRGDSGLNDGKDVGKDLTGGWLDAGDNVKFGFPMAYTATVLAWAYIEFADAFKRTGQAQYHLDNIRWATDYFIKAHTATTELYGQVGNGNNDHAFWGPAESLDAHFTPTTRPSYKITASCPGSDLAGETAAALAAASVVFRTIDPAYSNTLLTHARQLFDFAEQYLGLYTACITDARSFYSSSAYQDELFWGALWLYNATNNSTYLSRASRWWPSIANKVTGTHDWNDKTYGGYVLAAKLTREYTYINATNNWLDYWITGFNGRRITYTPGGLAYMTDWGPLRYPATTAFLGLIYANWTTDATRAKNIKNFAVTQIGYILGDNPLKRSYLGGFGTNPPVNPHHRTAHSSWLNSITNPTNNRHILYGALAGGPNQTDYYVDDRENYQKNEPACDYNAGFLGALAGLYLEYGGTPLASFPDPEARGVEFRVEASISNSTTNYVQVRAVIENLSGWPSRASTHLSYRYFLNLTAIIQRGYSASNVQVSLVGNAQNGTVGRLTVWNSLQNIYYVEVSFEGAVIFPGGMSAFSRDTQVRIGLPTGQTGWDSSFDWSSKGLDRGTPVSTPYIPVYDSGNVLYGSEPPK